MCRESPGRIVASSALLDRLAIGLGLDPPVLSALQIGDGREHVERVAALGRERGIGRGRAMQVEAEIVAQVACGRKCRAAVRDSADPAGWCDARRRRSGGRRRNTRRTGPSNSGPGRSCGRSIAVGAPPARDGDRSRPNRRWRRRCRRDASRPRRARRPFAPPSSTRIDSTSAPQRTLAALPLDQLDEPVDQRARAAHGEMHAPALFEEGDQAIDRARAERIAADQQRMKAEDRAQPLVAEIFRHQAVDAAIAFQPDEIGRRCAPCPVNELNGSSPSCSKPMR